MSRLTTVLALALAVHLQTATASADPFSRYRVTLAVQTADGAASATDALIRQCACRLEPYAQAGFLGFVMIARQSDADTLARDPRVAQVEELIPQSTPFAAPLPVASDPPPATGVAATKPPTSPSRRGEIGTDATASWPAQAYSYDGTGNITSIGADNYTYDAFGRLVTARTGGVSQTFGYDRFGNMTSMNTAGVTTNINVDSATNRLTGNTGASYDDVGRLTDATGLHVVYDPVDSAVEVTTPSGRSVHLYSASDERIASVAYDGAGVVKRTDWTVRGLDNKVLRRFVKDAAGNWSWQEDYVYRDGQLLAADVSTADQTLHYHLDHLGTPRLITNHSGGKVAEHKYFAFGGEQTSPAQDGERLKFTGHERDLSRLDYMHARYYRVDWARLLSVDPVLDSVSMSAPQSWNRYSYALNNPANNVDPDGRCAFRLTDGSAYMDSNQMCAEATADAHWSAAELRARADAANEQAKSDFLKNAKQWGSIKATLAKGKGGAFTFGQNDGQTFIQVQGGLGYGAGLKWDPAGRLPALPDGSTPPRAYVGTLATVSLSIGPISFDMPLRGGAIIYTESSGRTRLTGYTSWAPKFTMKWKQGFGLGISGIAGGDVGVTTDFFQ